MTVEEYYSENRISTAGLHCCSSSSFCSLPLLDKSNPLGHGPENEVRMRIMSLHLHARKNPDLRPLRDRCTAMATTIPNPKGLEGRKEGQTPAPQSRDFFWDSITLYIVAVILGLAAIDVITEFVRGSEVQCILPNETNSSLLASVRDYVNEFCAAHVPSLQSLPAFIALHAVFLLAPHYMWLNVYGADLDFFFQHVSQLVRTRDPKTGDYPAINYVISKQLEDAFTRSAHSNWMYHLYRIKLLVQLGFIIVGITVVPLLFKEQQVPFQCPKEDNDAKGDEWPLPDRETVVCVFSSLRLLQNVWGVYLFLLTGAIVFLIINMLMLMMPHTRELGFDNHAEFSFQTGMSYHYYVPHSLKKYFLEKFHCSLSWPFSPYSIRSDYDFLMIKLFRTDGGLAYILRETHILRLLNTKNSSDLAKVNLFRDKINVIQPRHAGTASTAGTATVSTATVGTATSGTATVGTARASTVTASLVDTGTATATPVQPLKLGYNFAIINLFCMLY